LDGGNLLQYVAHRTRQIVTHVVGVAELDFTFGGVHVDIYGCGIHGDCDHHIREAPFHQQCVICLIKNSCQLTSWRNGAPVDTDVHGLTAVATDRWIRNEPVDGNLKESLTSGKGKGYEV